MVGFFILVIFIGWFASLYFNSRGILYFFVLFSLGMNFFSYWYSDKIVLKISGAIPIEKEQYRDLWNTLENLCITAGLPMPKLYVIPEQAPNAFATGRDEHHASIAVTSGLLSILNKTELEGVLSHELSHIKNRDILVMTIVVVLVGFITIVSDFMLRSALWGGRDRDDNRSGQLQLIIMVAGLVLAILTPLFATIIQFAVSRKREFLADASGALLTRYPEGLANALRKISNNPTEMIHANHATAHMYISNPFKGKNTSGFVSKLFLTHPPVEERIAALLGMSK